MSGPRISIISRDPAFVAAVRDTAKRESLQAYEDISSVVELDHPEHRMIVDTHSIPPAAQKALLADLQARGSKVVPTMVGSLSFAESPHAWFEELKAQHWIAPYSADDAHRFLEGLNAVLEDKAPTLDGLVPNAKKKTWTYSSTVNLGGILNEVRAECETVVDRTRIVDSMISAVSELAVNALYHAPITEEGRRPFSDRPRSVPIIWPDDWWVTVETALSPGRCAVSISDPFGSLGPDTLVQYLGRSLRHDDSQVLSSTPGGGIGIYSSLMYASSLIYVVTPGKRTQAICVFEATHSFRAFASVPKSFHCFLVPEDS